MEPSRIGFIDYVTTKTPKKDVFAKGDDKTSIDGKQVKPGDELKYKIKYRNGTGKEQKVNIISRGVNIANGSAIKGKEVSPACVHQTS